MTPHEADLRAYGRFRAAANGNRAKFERLCDAPVTDEYWREVQSKLKA